MLPPDEIDNSFMKLIEGYQAFRDKYVLGDSSIMKNLSYYGQQPSTMIIACCDSRADPAVILQCDPGDLFVVRNVANIVPPYEKDGAHHGTSAALEFGVCFLKVKHLILLGHSQCGGIQALLDNDTENDFINNWVSQIKCRRVSHNDVDEQAKAALHQSYDNCLSFPWLSIAVDKKQLTVHRWFFDIKSGKIFNYVSNKKLYESLS